MSHVPKLILNEFYEREKTDKKMIKNLWKDDNAMAKNETYTSYYNPRNTKKNWQSQVPYKGRQIMLNMRHPSILF